MNKDGLNSLNYTINNINIENDWQTHIFVDLQSSNQPEFESGNCINIDILLNRNL